jgi:flagella basal body P-ring formation protein FlgA
VWARVEVTVKVTAVVTDGDLAQGATIRAASLRIETKMRAFDRVVPATRIEEVAGRIPKRALKAGSIIPLNALTEAPTVRRGDPVPVVVESGLARVRFEAIAESAARDGDMVQLKNPANGKTFKARLDPGPKVTVVIAWGQRL